MNHRPDLGLMQVGGSGNPLFQDPDPDSDPRERLAALTDQDLSEDEAISPSEAVIRARGRCCFSIFGLPSLFLRSKPKITNLETVYGVIHRARRIVVLMGAGASVGQDFRSPGGLYDTIRQSGRLDDPYQVFDLELFRSDPSIFWSFAYLVFPPENPAFSAAHYFVEALENRGKLLRVYSQNVDTLERGIHPSHLRCVHGSWRENRCVQCHEVYGVEDLRPAVAAQAVPTCVRCGGPIQPGIVFFGQPTDIDDREMRDDALRADLLLVIGTSLKVRPISDLPKAMADVTQILINREPVGVKFDAELLGDCADVVENLQAVLGWKEPEIEMREPMRLDSNRFVFPSESELGVTVIDTGRAKFLRTPARRDERDLD